MAWCTRSWSHKPGKPVKSPFTEFELRAGLSCLFTHFLGLQAVADLTSTFFSKKVLLSLVWYQPTDGWKRDSHLQNYLTAIFQHFIFCISIWPGCNEQTQTDSRSWLPYQYIHFSGNRSKRYKATKKPRHCFSEWWPWSRTGGAGSTMPSFILYPDVHFPNVLGQIQGLFLPVNYCCLQKHVRCLHGVWCFILHRMAI